MKILLVEDEIALSKDIVNYFKEDGIICESASTYQFALEKVAMYDYDCILLDLNLPDGEGMDVLRKVKDSAKKEGILIISARHSLDDKLDGLNLGADDYMVKPFHLSELKARVTAIVRRKRFDGQNAIVFNEIHIDPASMKTIVGKHEVILTRKEYDLLIYFIANRGKVVSKNAIAEHLWGDDIDLSDHFDFIYTHIKNLRKKLVEAGGRDYIKSMYGVGYKFENTEV